MRSVLAVLTTLSLGVASVASGQERVPDGVSAYRNAFGGIVMLHPSPSAHYAALSADGRWVVTAGDSTTRIWDARTKEEIHRFAFPSRAVDVGTWTVTQPDGSSAVLGPLLAAVAPEEVCVFETSALEATLLCQESEPTVSLGFDIAETWDLPVSFGAGGRLVATVIRRPEGVLARVSDVYEPETEGLTPGAAPGTPRVVRASGEDRLAIAYPSDVLDIAMSPDARWLAFGGADVAGTAQHGYLVIASVDPARATNPPWWEEFEHGRGVLALAFDPASTVLAAAGADKRVTLWKLDPASRPEKERTLKGHAAEVTRLAFSGDGRLLASASQDGTVIVWRVEDARKLQTWATGGPVWSLQFLADGDVVQWITASPSDIHAWTLKRRSANSGEEIPPGMG